MRDFDGVIEEVELIVGQRVRSKQQLTELIQTGRGMAVEDELQAELREGMCRNRARLLKLLQRTVEFPPHHVRHFALLDQFWRDGSYGQSVFVMSKFPDGSDPARDAELERVLAAASDAISDKGLTPRIARGPNRYHSALWDNVELHLLGCKQGIAIVEDRYLGELNPNVTMEWGWMRAMGKSVLFLVEEGFSHTRADVRGLIEDAFLWDNPEPGMLRAIDDWATRLQTA